MNKPSSSALSITFEKLTEVSIQRAPWIISLFAILTLLTLYYTVTHLKVHTDTQDMIASHLDWRQDFIHLKKTFPDNYQSVVAVIEGQSKASVQQAAKIFYTQLGLQPNLSNRFSFSLEPFFSDHQLLYLEDAQLQDVVQKSKQLQPFSSLHSQSLAGFANLLSRIDSKDSALNQDAFALGFSQALDASKDFKAYYLDWSSQFKPTDSYRSIIQIKPDIDYETLQPGLNEINQIKDSFQALGLEQQYNVQLKLTGDIPLNLEELQSVDKSAHFAAIAAFIMVAGLLLISFRSIKVVGLSLMVLIMGLCLTAGFATLTIGHLNMISVAFAVLYIGLSIDFTIHIIMRIKEQPELSTPEAIVKTIGHLGPALAFCALTTACAFYAFIPTTFKGISELGIIAGSGMIISFIMNIFLLPALLSRVHIHAHTIKLPMDKIRWPAKPVAIGFILAIIASFFILPKLSFNANPMDLRDPNQPSVLTYHELVEYSPYPPNAVTIIAKSQADAVDYLKTLESDDDIKDVISLQTFIPDNQTKKLQQLKSIQLAQPKRMIETPDEREKALDNLLKTYQSRSEPSSAMRQLVTALDQYQAFIKSLPHDMKNHYYDVLSSSLLLGLEHQLDSLRQSANAKAFTIEDLPEALTKRWTDGQNTKIDIYAKDDIRQASIRKPFVDKILNQFPHATGLPVIHQKAGEAVILAFMQAFTIALVIMVIFLSILLRDLKKIALTLVPLLSACLLTGAFSALLGISFNFANIIALPLLLGIGIDNGIHLIHRFYSNPQRSILGTSTTKAVIISTLTTIFSFANLSFSSHIGMSSMGLLLALGMGVTFLCTLVFLPSLLQWLHGNSKGS